MGWPHVIQDFNINSIDRASGTTPFLRDVDHGRITDGIKNGVRSPSISCPVNIAIFGSCIDKKISLSLGPIIRIAPNHLSFNSHAAQKVIYGFGTRTVPSMIKDPIFFTPEVDHSMNIINETDREEHSRMRRMLSFTFSTSNLLENEDVLVKRTNNFISEIGKISATVRSQGFNIVQQFNYVTFNIMGEIY